MSKKLRIMAQYNPALDLTALGLSLMRQGRTRMAAKVFIRASSMNSTESAIATLHASNQAAREAQLALKASTRSRRRLRAENEDEGDLSDEQIEQILEGDFGDADSDDSPAGIDIDLDAENDDDDDMDDDDDLGDDDDDLDADFDDEEEVEEFADVVASMRARGRRSRRR